MTRVSGAACVELNTPRGGLGEHDARRGQLENPGKSSARAHLRSSKRSSVRRVSAVSRDRKHADAARVRLRDVTRALGRSGLTRRGWRTPLSWMSNPRVAREHPAGCAWDSRWISAADLSAGFKEAVDARGCGARCTRRARERCAAPESVTGALKNLRGTKRQSDESWDLETDRGSRLITVFQTVEMSGLVYGTHSPKKRLSCVCVLRVTYCEVRRPGHHRR